MSPDEWQAVLALSETLGLDDVQQKAARNLKDMIFAGDPIEALLCAQKYHLDEWVAPLIDIIVKTKREISDEEYAELGMPMSRKITYAQGAADAQEEPSPNLSARGKKKGKR